MTSLARRGLLQALIALGAVQAAPALAASPGVKDALGALDGPAATRIGQAWLAAHPNTDRRALTARLAPAGWGPDAVGRLRAQVAADFRRGAVFIHRGWRLSDTEGALFGLLALGG